MKRRNGTRSARSKSGNNGSTATIQDEPRTQSRITAAASMLEQHVRGREPTSREIRDRAYFIYLERGGSEWRPKSRLDACRT